VDVVLRYFDGCPNWEVAFARLREALDAEGHSGTRPKLELASGAEEAERLRFRGSPTILIDGVDPFADECLPVGFTCRVFETETGLEGSPSVEQLRTALRTGTPSSAGL
jgi:hypothetical protein